MQSGLGKMSSCQKVWFIFSEICSKVAEAICVLILVLSDGAAPWSAYDEKIAFYTVLNAI